VVQQWNSAQTNTGYITLSGSPVLTATRNSSGSPTDAVGFALEGVTTGKFYWEESITLVTSVGTGVGNTSSSSSMGYLGSGTDSISYYQDGSVLGNTGGALLATLATFGSVVMCTALDLINNKIWWRPGTAANWNNDIIGNQNPATNTGGISIVQSGMTIISNAVVPGFDVFATNDALTAAFASSSWLGTPPSGFGPFDPDLMGAMVL
jgi:hypothetical protein